MIHSIINYLHMRNTHSICICVTPILFAYAKHPFYLHMRNTHSICICVTPILSFNPFITTKNIETSIHYFVTFQKYHVPSAHVVLNINLVIIYLTWTFLRFERPLTLMLTFTMSRNTLLDHW